MNKKENKKEAAKVLFMEGISQEEIGKILSIAPNTITKWKKEGNWENIRVYKNLSEATTQENARKALNYQFSLLSHWIDEQMKLDIEDRIPISSTEADGIVKLFKPIATNENKFETYIKIVRQFLTYLKEEDLELAKKTEPILQRFLNDIQKTLI